MSENTPELAEVVVSEKPFVQLADSETKVIRNLSEQVNKLLEEISSNNIRRLELEAAFLNTRGTIDRIVRDKVSMSEYPNMLVESVNIENGVITMKEAQ